MSDVNVIKAGQVRIFIQQDGNSPANAYDYFGAVSLGGLTEDLGGSTPVKLPSSSVRNVWEIIDKIPGERGLPTADFTQRMDKFLRDFWWEQRRTNCEFNAVLVLDTCGRPDDLDDWESKILLRKTRLTNFALPALNPLAEGENVVLDLTGSLEFEDFDKVAPISFSEKVDASVLASIIAIMYNDNPQCGDCGVASDGCQYCYALQIADTGSPGLSSQVIYSADGFDTGAFIDIPALAGAAADDFAAVGSYLVVISNADDSIQVALFDDVDAGTVNWTEVTTGLVGAGSPNAIYSKSPSKTFIAGDGGYIYKMTAPLSGVSVVTDGSLTSEDLNDIDGEFATVVAVGANNAVLVSTNDGDSFAAKTGPAVGVALNAVHVINEKLFWIGAANGNAYYTLDGGDNWTTVEVDSALTAIQDIQFVDEIVGYVAGTAAAGPRVYRTLDNGHTWHRTAPYLSDLPTATTYNCLDVCGYNKVAAGGVQSGGDGIIAVAE